VAAVVIRASHYRRTRWKNGAGETSEIAVSPRDATLDDFDWRISMATVKGDGPFSIFAGVDRTLCIIDGAGLEIHVAGSASRSLDSASPPFEFSGDLPVRSRLTLGTVVDFNVMTRRGRFEHRVGRVQLKAGASHDVGGSVRAIFCAAGEVAVRAAEQQERLEARDTMLRDSADNNSWTVAGTGDATVLLVSIREQR
jgi:hypothetical protein